MRCNVIRNLQYSDVQCLSSLQANQDGADHLFCSLMHLIVVTFQQPCPDCNGTFSDWSFETWQLNQGIGLNSEIVTMTLPAFLRINTPSSQVYNDLLHSGF